MNEVGELFEMRYWLLKRLLWVAVCSQGSRLAHYAWPETAFGYRCREVEMVEEIDRTLLWRYYRRLLI